jgi:hypothetical protein
MDWVFLEAVCWTLVCEYEQESRIEELKERVMESIPCACLIQVPVILGLHDDRFTRHR